MIKPWYYFYPKKKKKKQRWYIDLGVMGTRMPLPYREPSLPLSSGTHIGVKSTVRFLIDHRPRAMAFYMLTPPHQRRQYGWFWLFKGSGGVLKAWYDSAVGGRDLNLRTTGERISKLRSPKRELFWSLLRGQGKREGDVGVPFTWAMNAQERSWGPSWSLKYDWSLLFYTYTWI